MPGKKKLQEEYEDIKKEEIDEQIKKAEEAVEKKRKEISKFRVRKFKNDVFYTIIISIILGFILWAWKPDMFTFWKALALGFAWYLLFDELKLQNLFKRE